jgi:Ring finger domain
MADCAICFELLNQNNVPLICGHVFHEECMNQQIKKICALCRKPFEIDIIADVELELEEEIEVSSGYLFPEEDPEYDSENPYGDEYEY